MNYFKIGKSVLKYAFNRARGVKYGAIMQGGKGPIQLVPSKKLSKMNSRLVEEINDYSKNLSSEKLQVISRQLKPFNVKTQATSGNLSYFNTHGAMQVWDNSNNKLVVDVVNRLKNPTITYIKSLF